MKDADIIAFYADPTLQEAFVQWANQSNKVELIQKKWEKFAKLKLEQARDIGRGDYEMSLR